ncbi:DUF1828 domain-containing protein [Methylococcus capsulatus]|uniref:DUF1828 domain-containing protein n=1 Tax=Methylococcus capsulatus TaxID=414 RepID=UPI001C52C148|nr:DUF1828 domain-containing protein [Methylococcus capsulatus]QXP89499.1 DUF1828 domain-containing protein [Methylococcus capsulatus]
MTNQWLHGQGLISIRGQWMKAHGYAWHPGPDDVASDEELAAHRARIMIADIQSLVDAYHVWLKDKTVLERIDDWVEITTPYLDRHNDYIQIYARWDDGGVLLTDDGYTLEDLRDGGCKLDSPKRQALLMQTLNGFGVQLSGDRIEVHATPENFALRKHDLVQAMLAVPMVASMFYDLTSPQV